MLKVIRKNRLLVFIIIVFAIYMGFLLIQIEIKYREVVDDREEFLAKIEELQESIDELQDEIDKAGSDEYIERIAREKLKMVKPDEIIYILEE